MTIASLTPSQKRGGVTLYSRGGAMKIALYEVSGNGTSKARLVFTLCDGGVAQAPRGSDLRLLNRVVQTVLEECGDVPENGLSFLLDLLVLFRPSEASVYGGLTALRV